MRIVSATFVAIALVAMPAPSRAAGESQWQKQFAQTYEAAQQAESAKDWSKAERLYADVQKLVPHEISTQVARARCLAELKRYDEAVACLTDAVEHGWNQPDQLRTTEAFKPLQDRDDFKRLFKRIDEIEKDPTPVYIPANLDKSKPAPLIVAFHGRFENPHYYLPVWKPVADKIGAVVVAPRGVDRAGKNLLNMWESPEARKRHDIVDIDLPKCKAITKQAISYAESKAKIDRKRIVLAGYSQGGAVALALLADDPKPYAGAFVQATLYKSIGVAPWKAARAKRAGRVVILMGALDRLTQKARQASDELKAAGWDVRYEEVPNVGHEPPDDNVRRQVEAVRFVLGEGEKASTRAATSNDQ